MDISNETLFMVVSVIMNESVAIPKGNPSISYLKFIY